MVGNCIVAVLPFAVAAGLAVVIFRGLLRREFDGLWREIAVCETRLSAIEAAHKQRTRASH